MVDPRFRRDFPDTQALETLLGDLPIGDADKRVTPEGFLLEIARSA